MHESENIKWSCSVVSDSSRPRGLHPSRPLRPWDFAGKSTGVGSRLPCPSPTPRVYSNSCLLSRWCHPTISSSVFPLSSCLQFFPAAGSFLISWLLASRGQSIGASASASALPMSIQCWFILELTSLIFLNSKGLSRVFSSTSLKASFLQHSAYFIVQFSHPSVTTEKTIALTIWTFVGNVMSLLFNTLPKFVIAFLPRSKHLLISWLQSPSAVILELK